MSFEMTSYNITRYASADLSAAQYHCVKQDVTGGVVLCNTAGEKVLGILLNDPLLNQTATVAVSGVVKCVAGGAVAIGSDVSVNGNGRIVTATAGKKIIGESITATSANGETISVLLRSGAASA